MSKTYTMEEVRKHKTTDSLWIVVHGKVYDVTKYQDEHPGGPEILLDNSGRDSTKAFEDIGHSADAKKIMQKYVIGTVAAGSTKSSALNDVIEDVQKKYAAITLGVALCLGANFLVYKQLSK